MKKTFCIYTLFPLFLINPVKAQVEGCTDPLATNYNSLATKNDGSCIYENSTVTPSSTVVLPDILEETSGLALWNNQLWTHNDNSDINLYSFDTISGNIIQPYPMNGVVNNDWEEISQDNIYLYIGDFGNNSDGNRTDLKILKIEKNSILNNTPVIDTINFSYSNQTSYAPAGPNNTDFDCEAFVISADSIYLFTKQWISNKTSMYSLSKSPGTHIATLKATFDIEGLVTGAVLLPTQRIVALCGYSNLLQPFIYLLYDFKDTGFFGGNKRKIEVSLPFHQIEGIATTNGLKYYLSNEHYSKPPFINIRQKFHTFDLSSFLGDYLENLTLNVEQEKIQQDILVYPNPVNNILYIDSKYLFKNYCFVNSLGMVVKSGKLIPGISGIDLSGLPEGVYFLSVGETNCTQLIAIKR
jgi:hypothetical protein